MDDRLHRELWTSWASMLRSYAAAHGLNSTHHAVVEVSLSEITLRVHTRWLRFTPAHQTSSEGLAQPFSLEEDGTVSLDGHREEMDMAAERLTRALLIDPSASLL